MKIEQAIVKQNFWISYQDNWIPFFIQPKLNGYINKIIPRGMSRRKRIKSIPNCIGIHFPLYKSQNLLSSGAQHWENSINEPGSILPSFSPQRTACAEALTLWYKYNTHFNCNKWKYTWEEAYARACTHTLKY